MRVPAWATRCHQFIGLLRGNQSSQLLAVLVTSEDLHTVTAAFGAAS
jgi:hypothetical protein